MKKIFYTILAISAIACGSESSKSTTEPTQKPIDTSCVYSYISDSTKFQWTAYKTTEKIPVSGSFNEINVSTDSNINVHTITDAIKSLSFSIPVSSINSNNPDRDWKVVNIFFAAMDSTQNLTGFVESIDGNENNGSLSINIKMNNANQKMNASYAVNGNKVDVVGSFDLLDWQANKAVDSIHETCKDLHTGPDGISKTWSDIGIAFTIVFNKQCK